MIMRILIVDDSTTARRILKESLLKIGYNDFTEAGDGSDAFYKLKTTHFDLVITDWNMPNMNGLELLKKIRSLPETANIPVLMITTRGTKEDVIEAVKAKLNNYMVKPFTPEILKSKIDSIFEMKK